MEDGADVGEGLARLDEPGRGGRESSKGGGSGAEGRAGEGGEEGHPCGDIQLELVRFVWGKTGPDLGERQGAICTEIGTGGRISL